MLTALVKFPPAEPRPRTAGQQHLDQLSPLPGQLPQFIAAYPGRHSDPHPGSPARHAAAAPDRSPVTGGIPPGRREQVISIAWLPLLSRSSWRSL